MMFIKVSICRLQLKQLEQFDTIEEVHQTLDIEQLPDLSLSNVKELLRAVMPLPQLSKQQACDLVALQLFKRSISTQSRWKNRNKSGIHLK